MPDYLFVTGKLAADALIATLEQMEPDFEYEVAVLNISVAALMNTRWIAQQLADARGCQRVMISGWCQGDLSIIEERVGVPVIRGPKDLKALPVFFGREQVREGYGEYRVKILAEIVEAYRMSWEDILARAEYYRASGADISGPTATNSNPNKRFTNLMICLLNSGFSVTLFIVSHSPQCCNDAK